VSSDVGQTVSSKQKLKYQLARRIRRTPWLLRSIERLYGGLFGLLYEELQPGKKKS
jgi:hypothetical protein